MSSNATLGTDATDGGAATAASGERPPLALALAGGGTGGHILPGRYVLAHGRARARLSRVLWFQTGRTVEERAMHGVAEELAPVPCERVALPLEPPGGGAPSLARLSALTLPATRAARAALARSRCDVLLGLGGFTALPAVLAARSLGIPVALLEVNAASGRATRWLAPLSARVLHAWRTSLPSVRDRHLWIGPPLARAFERGRPSTREEREAKASLGFDPDRPLLLVLGGSQGAAALNRFVAVHAEFLAQNGIQVLHQTGPDRAEEGAHEELPGYLAVEYVYDVHRALSAATLVLCRGGASTVAEVAALEKPAWVVPYPHHADRHQEKNARELGAGARIVEESALDLGFARELVHLAAASGESEREHMRAALSGCVPHDSAGRLWRELELLAGIGTAAGAGKHG